MHTIKSQTVQKYTQKSQGPSQQRDESFAFPLPKVVVAPSLLHVLLGMCVHACKYICIVHPF